jgi:tripartite-type tricarboxylate transporter receptor subunit TctC
MKRRKYLKLGGLASVAGVAGCTSGIGGEQEASEGQWPPPRNTVDFVAPSEPGDTRYAINSAWASTTSKYFPGDVETTVTPMPGAGGLLATNTTYRDAPDGGTNLTMGKVPMGVFYMKSDQAQFDPREFIQFVSYQRKARAIQINHRTTDVEDHWDWDYDTIVEELPDLTMGAVAITHDVVKNFWEEFEPRLNQGDIELVRFPSGGEARAAIQRGELDGYFGAFGPNYPRSDSYKMQLVYVTDDYPTHVDAVKNVTNNQTPDKEPLLIHETDMPEDGARVTTDVSLDTTFGQLPPETSQEIVDIYAETFQKASDDQETKDAIGSTLGAPEINFSGIVEPEEFEEGINNVISLYEEYEDLLPEISE